MELVDLLVGIMAVLLARDAFRAWHLLQGRIGRRGR